MSHACNVAWVDTYAHFDSEDPVPTGLPPARVLVDEVEAAIYLTRHIAGIDPPTPQAVQRWRTLIRVWANRGKVTRYGGTGRGRRRYDLRELVGHAERRNWTDLVEPDTKGETHDQHHGAGRAD